MPMTDDGLTFFATIETRDGAQLHRETPSRFELLQWVTSHEVQGARVVKLATEATTDEAIRKTLMALFVGAKQMVLEDVALRAAMERLAGEAPLVVPTREPSTLDVARRAYRASGGGTPHECHDWLRTDGSCALCGRTGLAPSRTWRSRRARGAG